MGDQFIDVGGKGFSGWGIVATKDGKAKFDSGNVLPAGIVGVLAGLANERVVPVHTIVHEMFALSRVCADAVVWRFSECPHIN